MLKAFIGIDAAKSEHAIAIAEEGREGEVRFFGKIPATPEAMRRLIGKLGAKYDALEFVYEAGPTGYGLYRQITQAGHRCAVIAPSLIPKKPGDRVKTNRRDALTLARLHRAGELTAVWVPDEAHEALRDLVRAREAAVEDLRAKRQQAIGFLLRGGRVFPGRTLWSKAFRRWLAEQSFAHRAQHIVLEEILLAVKDAEERLARLTAAIEAAARDWVLAPLVEALQCLRGLRLVSAVTLAVEIGDFSRFKNAKQLMAFLGLTPSEASTGDDVRRGRITKAGNGRARRTLIESAWSYKHPPRVGPLKQLHLDAASKPVRDIAWRAQTRLCARYRALIRAGKRSTVAVTAVARELAGFVWDLARVVTPPPPGRPAAL